MTVTELRGGTDQITGGVVTFNRETAEVTAIKLPKKSLANGRAEITTSDGKKVRADHVLLATGFDEPKTPEFLAGIVNTSGYLASPYQEGARSFFEDIKPHERVLCIGTGLTAYDTLISLDDAGYKGKGITCVSRGGNRHHVYPVGHGATPEPLSVPSVHDVEDEDRYSPETFADGVTLIEEIWDEALESGFTSEQILMNFERHIPHILERAKEWGKTGELLKTFNRHASFITTNRVGVIAAIGARIRQMEEDERVTFTQRDIQKIKVKPNGTYDVYFKGRSTPQNYHYVVNALGYETDVLKMKNPLIKQLLKAGAIRPHAITDNNGKRYETGMGIDVDTTGLAIGKNGDVTSGLSAAGVLISGATLTGALDGQTGGRLGPFSLNLIGISDSIPAIAEQAVVNAIFAYRGYLDTRVDATMRLDDDNESLPNEIHLGGFDRSPKPL
jgi:uncharacterized NAD(P)/FAD-binding protein YdhS